VDCMELDFVNDCNILIFFFVQVINTQTSYAEEEFFTNKSLVFTNKYYHGL